MVNYFPNGGTNSDELTYTDVNQGSEIHVSSRNSTLTNQDTGKIIFSPSPTNNYTVAQIDGSLINNGLIENIPKANRQGYELRLGTEGAGNSFSNNGSIIFNQLDATSGISTYFYFTSMVNDVNGIIDIRAQNAGTVRANYVGNLTNAGKINIQMVNGGGMASSWGNGTGTFNNTGSFVIDNGTATSGASYYLNFIGYKNDGNVSFSYPSGSTVGITVGAGGYVNNGTWTYDNSANNGNGNVYVTGGSGNYYNNGTINVNGTYLRYDLPLIASAGSEGTINLINGAQLTLSGSKAGAGQFFTFTGGNNTLYVADGANFTGVIRGFTQGDTLTLVGVTGTPVYDPETGILTITALDGKQYTYDIGVGYDGTFSMNGYTLNYTGDAACYLAGSMILTPEGEVAVENLSLGDYVVTFDWQNQTRIIQEVIATGGERIIVNPVLPDDRAGYPVRVLKDAIVAGVPDRDLLITAEHCLFFNDKFVPVRMLVNGRNIFYDYSFTEFDIYHVETKNHAVLIANNVFSESFLNTCNHSILKNNQNVISIQKKTWKNDAAAELCTRYDFVKPIFNQIEKNATQGNIDKKTVTFNLTDDPNMYIMTNTGQIIQPVQKNKENVIFHIPEGVKNINILSMSSRPCDAVGPFVDDRRNLGVLIGDIIVITNDKTTKVRSHLTDTQLYGWHVTEQSHELRWTTGNAFLSLGECCVDQVSVLVIQVKAGGPYILSEQQQDEYLDQAV